MYKKLLVFAALGSLSEASIEPGCDDESFPVINGAHGPVRMRYPGKKFSVVTKPFDLHYGQVHNRQMDPVPLPEEIIGKFDGKTMSITGYTVEYLRKDSTGEFKPVPVSELYNHHYIFYASQAEAHSGEATEFAAENRPKDRRGAGNVNNYHQFIRSARNLRAPSPSNNPPFHGDPKTDGTNGDFVTVFSEANGGEFQCTFHGYGKGYAQKLHSPKSLVFFGHIINTHWKANSLTEPAPLPASSLVDSSAAYSGMIECPCTNLREVNRFQEIIDGKPIAVSFGCSPDLRVQNNPSCTVKTYAGGLRCCEDKTVLLDKGQYRPDWVVETFSVRVSFWYLDEAKNSVTQSHNHINNAFRLYLQTEGRNDEYDVPKCQDGVPASQCIHTITNRFTIQQLLESDCDAVDPWCASTRFVRDNRIRLVYAAGHLHVGAISMELIDTSTGQTLCLVKPVYGSGDKVGDAAGYLSSIPPCVWGVDDSDGLLLSAPWVDIDTELLTVAKYNSSTPHYGVMAQWSMRGAYE